MTDADALRALADEPTLHFSEGDHFNGGREWFGYGGACGEHPRIYRLARYYHDARGTRVEFQVDGEKVADLPAALERVKVPPILTADNATTLALVPDDWSERHPWKAWPGGYSQAYELRRKGLIEADAGRAREGLTSRGHCSPAPHNRRRAMGSEQVEVIQADREAAAVYLREVELEPDSIIAMVRSGKPVDHALSMHFAHTVAQIRMAFERAAERCDKLAQECRDADPFGGPSRSPESCYKYAAEQIRALRALKAITTPQLPSREEIARVVNPTAWWGDPGTNAEQQDALALADAILALLGEKNDG